MEYGINKLKRRILEISYKYQLSHIGSCITAVDIIDEIYSIKKEDELFCLGNSHAFLALAVILEKYEDKDAELLYKHHGTHANRDLENKIFVSGGNLGIVESIALGMAIGTSKNIWLLSSDGGMMEELPWGVLRIKADKKINNLKWYINANSFGAFDNIDVELLEKRIHCFCSDVKVIRTNYGKISFLNGINAHYKKISKKEWESINV